MHICFLTTEYPPLPAGGIGTSVQNLARALVRRGERVTVLGWGRPAEWEDRGVRVRMLDSAHPPRTGWLLNRLRLQRELRRLVREEDLRIVEAPDWCGMSAGLQPGCPLAIRLHGSAVYFGGLLGERVRHPVRWAEWAALQGADAIAGVGRFVAERTRADFGLRRPVGAIANGVDLEMFSPAGDADPHLVLYFGALVRKKGVLELCEAFSTLARRLPAARLLLIGRDARDARTGAASTWELCRSALSPAAAGQVRYLGPQPYTEIAGYVRRAAVCVFPSHAEALPLSWLEAMACAKPILAFDLAWAAEVVVDGQTGLLVPRGDTRRLAAAIADLLERPERARAMGRAARLRAERFFSAARAAEQSLEWYRSLNGNHGG